jgi:hypothetical protein
MTLDEGLRRQIEAAYDYRGHVTVTFKDGSSIEGFVFNRQYASPLLKEPPFIELFPKGSDERMRFPMESIRSIELTGADAAAGKSYGDYLKKQAATNQ